MTVLQRQQTLFDSFIVHQIYSISTTLQKFMSIFPKKKTIKFNGSNMTEKNVSLQLHMWRPFIIAVLWTLELFCNNSNNSIHYYKITMGLCLIWCQQPTHDRTLTTIN